jgi:hypothetical protein
MEQEVWKDAVGYPGYEVSSLGRVRQVRYLTLSPPIPKASYPRTSLHLGPHKNKTVKVHHLVAEAFLGPRPAGYEVDHLDFNHTNNRADNLEYVTNEENTRRAVAAGLMGRKPHHKNKGQFHHKLTAEQVAEIRRLLPDETMQEIAKQFGVSAEMIRLIRNGKLWTP